MGQIGRNLGSQASLEAQAFFQVIIRFLGWNFSWSVGCREGHGTKRPPLRWDEESARLVVLFRLGKWPWKLWQRSVGAMDSMDHVSTEEIVCRSELMDQLYRAAATVKFASPQVTYLIQTNVTFCQCSYSNFANATGTLNRLASRWLKLNWDLHLPSHKSTLKAPQN